MTRPANSTGVTLTTALRPGAVAILQLHGPGTEQALHRLTGHQAWELGGVRLVDMAGVDTGLACLLRGGERAWAQLMPHGGPRVVQNLLRQLSEYGVTLEADPAPWTLYPEADSPIQADALAVVARAASPAAIDPLLAQPGLWRDALRDPSGIDRDELRRHLDVLGRLIDPPTVVVVGRPNVGKSTLTNCLMGRSVSLVADLPGTTRDWVGGMVELGGWGLGVGDWGKRKCTDDECSDSRLRAAGRVVNQEYNKPMTTFSSPIPDPQSPTPAIAVRWLDTPGLRVSDDGIEQRAIEIAQDVIALADVLIVMRDPDQDWPEPGVLPREPDLWVVNKMDGPQRSTGCALTHGDPLRISAQTGQGIDTLQQRVVAALGLDRIEPDSLWAFSDTLRRYVLGETDDLSGYLG